MKKIPLFTKRAALRIAIAIGLFRFIYSLFIYFPAPVLYIGGNAYFINLVWNTDQNPEIWKIGTNLKHPQFITMRKNPKDILPFIKDDFHIYSIMDCPGIPATGFDAPSFEGVGVWTGGFIFKDKNGTYISNREGEYGRPQSNCSNEHLLPFAKISE